MTMSRMVEKLPQGNNTFSQKITGKVKNMNRCYQCSMCSNGCPVAADMDYYPNQIIRFVQMGLKDKVLSSRSIWLCTSCETCATRCPNEIEIVRLMDLLRHESRVEGITGSTANIIKFHEAFVDQIRLNGRLNESSLMVHYELETLEFLSTKKMKELIYLGWNMFRKGSIKMPSLKRHSPMAVKNLFNHIFQHTRKGDSI